MKKNLNQITKKLLAPGLAIACLAVSAVHAQTVTNVFSFQKGNVTKDGVAYGSGTGYSGVLDGVVGDGNAAATLSTSLSAAVGDFFKSGSPNGQQNCGFFSYDLTDLKNFITANTSVSSTVTVASVSMTFITASAGSTTGGNYAWALYGSDPFTSSCTWSNYNGVNPWTAPAYQNLASPNNTVQYGYTGGGSAAASYPQLNTNSVFLNGVASGGALNLFGGANFVSAVTNALARTDKTLYLTLRIPTLGNGDSRQTLIFSPTNTVAFRPQIQVTVVVVGTPPASSTLTWKGGASATWDTSALNWNDGANTVAYSNGKNLTFDDSLSNPLNNNITLSSTYSPSNILASNSTYDYSLTGGGLTGNMNLTKQGGKTFSLGMSNSYSGLTTVNGGILLISDPNALGSVLTNVLVASGGALSLSNGITLSGKPITLNGGSDQHEALRSADTVNPVTVSCPITVGSSTAYIGTGNAANQMILTNCTITDNGNGYTLRLNSSVTGAKLQVNTAGIMVSNVFLYTYLASAGLIAFGVDNCFPNSVLTTDGGQFDLNGTSQSCIGWNAGTYQPKLGYINNSSATTSTLTINVPSGRSFSSSSVLEGNVNLVVNGPGTQGLNGGVAHTFTGTTIVNGATLGLASSMSGATGGVTVTNGGILHGYSTIGGSVTINTNCIFYPGYTSNQVVSPYGLNTLGDLTLKKGSITIACINPDLSPSNNTVTVGGTLTYGGTLVVYSIGHTNALQPGETFTIFPNGGTGNFDNVVFNSIESQSGTSVSFDPATGTVTVTGTTAPTLSIAPQGGNVMQLNWNSSFYKLQKQTNSTATGLGGNWVDILNVINGPTTTNVINDLTIGSTFYRLAPKP